MAEEQKNTFSKEFEERVSWDEKSLSQLVMLDPVTLEPLPPRDKPDADEPEVEEPEEEEHAVGDPELEE